MNLLQLLNDIRTATLQARKRLADDTIATRTQAGQVQIVRVEYTGKRKVSHVTPLSQYMAAAEVVGALDAL